MMDYYGHNNNRHVLSGETSYPSGYEERVAELTTEFFGDTCDRVKAMDKTEEEDTRKYLEAHRKLQREANEIQVKAVLDSGILAKFTWQPNDRGRPGLISTNDDTEALATICALRNLIPHLRIVLLEGDVDREKLKQLAENQKPSNGPMYDYPNIMYPGPSVSYATVEVEGEYDFDTMTQEELNNAFDEARPEAVSLTLPNSPLMSLEFADQETFASFVEKHGMTVVYPHLEQKRDAIKKELERLTKELEDTESKLESIKESV